jgi:hypothetical protein
VVVELVATTDQGIFPFDKGIRIRRTHLASIQLPARVPKPSPPW